MNHAHWTNKEETFYSYATGNIYYTMQKNYNEVKSSTSVISAVSNFLKLNMQNTLHSFIFFSEFPVFIGGSEGEGCISTLNHP